MSAALPKGWIRGSTKYFIDHVDGRWRISKAYIKDVACYTLWKSVKGKWALYGNHDSVQEAVDAAAINKQKIN